MADGTVRIGLSSPPAGGRANRELVRFVADETGVPRSSVTIVSGATSRRKRLRVEDPAALPGWLPGHRG